MKTNSKQLNTNEQEKLERKRAYQRNLAKEWRKNNPEKARANKQKCYQNNRGKYIEYSRKYRQENPQKIKDSIARYRKNDPEKIKEINRKSYLKHIDKRRAENREYMNNWIKKNPEEVLKRRCIQYAKLKANKEKWEQNTARLKEYAQKNPTKIRETARRYRQNNPEKDKANHRRYLANNHNARLASTLRSRVYSSLKAQNAIKYKKTIELVGCSISELKIYIENQFKPGMSWSNHQHNIWHIDHKKPCASYDLTKLEEQKKCFHYTNLQPLWAFDNLSKGAKISA